MAADGAERRRFAALMDRLIKSEPKVQDYNWTSFGRGSFHSNVLH